MEHAEHQDGVAVVAVLKRILTTEHLENDLAVFVTTGDCPSQLRMPAEDVCALDQFTGDVGGDVGKPVVQEGRESIEVVKSVERPLYFYRPGHGRNPEVPHVRSHWTTRSCGTRASPEALT